MRKKSSPGWLTWLLLALALLLRLEHRHAYRNFFLDTEVQAGAAWQLSQGRPAHWPQVDSTDWSQTFEAPVDMFAPGFTQLLSLPLHFTDDPYQAVWWVDAMSLLLLFAAVHLIFFQLTGTHHARSYRWYLVFIALSPAPLHYLTASGLWTLTLLAWAWLLVLQEFSYLRALAALALMLLAAYSRMAYLGLLPLLPLYWLAQGLRLGDRRPTWLGAATLLLAAARLGWEQVHSSVPGYYAGQTGWYPEHLLHLTPVAFKAFFYYGVPQELWLRGVYPLLLGALLLVSHSASLALLSLFGWWGSRRWLAEPQSVPARFALLVAFTLALVVALLSYQSLIHPPESWNWTGFWTFVMEPRYYAPAMLGLVIGLFYLSDELPPGWLRRALRLWLLLVTLAAYSYPLWLKLRLRVLGQKEGTHYADRGPDYVAALRAVQDTASLPLVALGHADSQAPVMVGIPTATVEELFRYRGSQPIWLATPPDFSVDLPQATLLAEQPHYRLWRIESAGKPGAE